MNQIKEVHKIINRKNSLTFVSIKLILMKHIAFLCFCYFISSATSLNIIFNKRTNETNTVISKNCWYKARKGAGFKG